MRIYLHSQFKINVLQIRFIKWPNNLFFATKIYVTQTLATKEEKNVSFYTQTFIWRI